MPARTCKKCSKVFTPLVGYPTYCPDCRTGQVYLKVCVKCGGEFQAKSKNAKWCLDCVPNGALNDRLKKKLDKRIDMSLPVALDFGSPVLRAAIETAIDYAPVKRAGRFTLVVTGEGLFGSYAAKICGANDTDIFLATVTLRKAGWVILDKNGVKTVISPAIWTGEAARIMKPMVSALWRDD